MCTVACLISPHKNQKAEVASTGKLIVRAPTITCLLNEFSKPPRYLKDLFKTHDYLHHFFADRLDVHQHGFVKNKSTVDSRQSTLTNLSQYAEYISSNLDAGFEVHAIFKLLLPVSSRINYRHPPGFLRGLYWVRYSSTLMILLIF